MHLGPNRPVDAIANALWAVRTAQRTANKTIVLIEGDDDERFFGRYVDGAACYLRAPYGRPRVLETLEGLRMRKVQGVVAIVDADYDRILGTGVPDPDVVVTDNHDVETMLVCSPALDNVLRELGDRARIDGAEQAAGCCVREIVLKACAPMGAARLVCRRRGWSVRFDAIEHERFVHVDTLEVDLDALLTELRGRQAGAASSARMELNAKRLFEEELARGHPLEELCQGHDLVAVLGLALRRLLGQRLPNEVASARVALALRLGFEEGHFRKTALAEGLRNWEARNPGFRIFRRVR